VKFFNLNADQSAVLRRDILFSESRRPLTGLGVGVDGPRRLRLCQNEVVADLKQRGPSVEQISRIGMDTSKHFFQFHGVNAAENVVLRKKLRRKEMARLTGKTAAETISVMLAVFGRINPALRKSITFDNDTAFAQHALLRAMRDMATWFCDAYASWQKGGVENANGRLRRWLPRHIDIDRLSDGDIQDIVMTANLTPLPNPAPSPHPARVKLLILPAL
jgi:IS30 family transposase